MGEGTPPDQVNGSINTHTTYLNLTLITTDEPFHACLHPPYQGHDAPVAVGAVRILNGGEIAVEVDARRRQQTVFRSAPHARRDAWWRR